METSGLYDVSAVRKVRTKKPSSHGSTGVRNSTGRGRTRSRATQDSIASSHAVCVPAIECGAAAAYRNRHATVARSSQVGKGDGVRGRRGGGETGGASALSTSVSLSPRLPASQSVI